MAVRSYARFHLSLRDVRDLLAERGVDVSPSTILHWVHTFGPLLAGELQIRQRARPLGGRWYVDETYVRVGGQWAYLYRAVEETGQVVGILLRERHDPESVLFLQQARRRRAARPDTVTVVRSCSCASVSLTPVLPAIMSAQAPAQSFWISVCRTISGVGRFSAADASYTAAFSKRNSVTGLNLLLAV